MRIVCIVQARMESTRLPGKVLLPLGGLPVIQHVLDACGRIKGVDTVVCAMPTTPATKPLLNCVQRLDVPSYLGHPTDCLNRYWHAAKAYRADVIMRVTGDCPMLTPFWCEQTLARLPGYDYADNTREVSRGRDCQVFTWEALDRAYHNATEAYDREHVCPWMQRHMLVAPPLTSTALDTPEDYERLKEKF